MIQPVKLLQGANFENWLPLQSELGFVSIEQ